MLIWTFRYARGFGTNRLQVTVELRHKAIEVVLAFTAGAFQTTLLTYLIQRDLFPSIMKVRAPTDTNRDTS